MIRDCDTEFNYLHTVEREAFRARNAAFAERLPLHMSRAPADMALLARCEATDKIWKAAKADVAALMAEYRQAA